MNLLVLVVDDEPDVELLFRQQFRHDLRSGRFTMEFAQSAPAALQRITDASDASAFYWVFGRFIGVIRWALDRIAYALGVILFSAAVVSGVFASAGIVAAVAIWLMSNINLAAR